MAQRRMFSPQIVSSDAFLDMPTSSRELYFQLGMFADDDGFINPKRIIRMIGASDDDLKILLTKRFALPFENGVVVIKHWRINNFIRKDRYKQTLYLTNRNHLYIKENGAYTDNPNKGILVSLVPWKSDNEMAQQRDLPPVDQKTYQRSTQVRLGKDNNTHTSPSARGLSTKKKTMKNSFKYNESQSSDTFEDVIDLDTGAPAVTKPKVNASKTMLELLAWAEKRRGSKFVNIPKQLKALSKIRASGRSPNEVKSRWIELESDDFYKKAGIDFVIIANSFDRK